MTSSVGKVDPKPKRRPHLKLLLSFETSYSRQYRTCSLLWGIAFLFYAEAAFTLQQQLRDALVRD